MRKIVIIWLLALSLMANGNTYYVAPTGGSDSNPGTIGSPWATPQKAFNTADAGDTVFFRGGIYYPIEGLEIIPPTTGNTGTAANPICYFNYPGETPIFDFANCPPDGNYITALFIQGAHFLRFRGITVRNVYQRVINVQAMGVYSYDCTNLYFENVTLHHISGNAFRHLGYFDETTTPNYDSTYYINCDTYDNCDSLQINPANEGYEGGSADGWKMFTEPNGYLYFEGCRAWRNSDDGFDPTGSYHLVIKNCWSFNNGYLAGDGSGFKVGGNGAATDESYVPDPGRVHIELYNNILAGNDGNGVQIVEYPDYYRSTLRAYNNSLYDNNGGGFTHGYNVNYDYNLAWYYNNIVYSSGAAYSCSYIAPAAQGTNTFIGVEEYPSWTTNPAFTVTAGDFVSLDISELDDSRQADGSLPQVSFMKLSSGSDLIDGGTNIGLPYSGATPDLGYAEWNQIIADHTIIDDFDDIPANWIDSVKTMLVAFPGESHSAAYRTGMTLLEAQDATYAVEVGEGLAYTDDYLRVEDIGFIGEDYFFTWEAYPIGSRPTPASTMFKGMMTSYNSAGHPYSVFGFAWCNDLTASDFGNSTNADPTLGVHWYGRSAGGPDGNLYWGIDDADVTQTGNDVSLQTYFRAFEEFIYHCEANSPSTKVVFTTGPVDETYGEFTGESGYQGHLKHEAIRDYVRADNSRILFDYADILCYDDDGTPTTQTWNGHTYPFITTTNYGDATIGHISSAGAIRLAKAQWWLLARVAGWNGLSVAEVQVDSTLTDILTFTLPTQTGAATINTTAHTIAIEVNYLATVTNLTPYISLSYGATISPTSMTSRDFTTPQTYTVTALDGTTTQDWVVTVTQAEAPPPDPPEVDTSRIIKFNGGHLRKFRP